MPSTPSNPSDLSLLSTFYPSEHAYFQHLKISKKCASRSFSIPKDVSEELTRYCHLLNIPASEVVTFLIRDWLPRAQSYLPPEIHPPHTTPPYRKPQPANFPELDLDTELDTDTDLDTETETETDLDTEDNSMEDAE